MGRREEGEAFFCTMLPCTSSDPGIIPVTKVDQKKNKNAYFYVENLSQKYHGTHDNLSL
jgi:hypothetical protein